MVSDVALISSIQGVRSDCPFRNGQLAIDNPNPIFTRRETCRLSDGVSIDLSISLRTNSSARVVSHIVWRRKLLMTFLLKFVNY